MSNKPNINYFKKLKDTMFEISKSVHDLDNIDELYKAIHHSISDLIHTNNLFIAILNKETNFISFPYYVDINDSIPENSIELGKGLTSMIIKSSKPLLIDKQQYNNLFTSAKLGTAPESWLGVPLKLHSNEIIGVLAVQSYSKNIIFDKKDLAILNFSAEQITIAIEKFNAVQQIKRKSEYDELTGLPNKALFFDIALKMIQNSKEENNRIFFVLLDLDDFMLIIDTHGYDIGNKIIEVLSKRLSETVNDDEIISYWGGDKFNIILKLTSLDKDIKKKINKIAQAIKKPININNNTFTINSSIGVSIFPDHNDNLNHLIRDSEIAMNHVKNHGKNNIKFYKHKLKEKLMEQFGIEVSLRKAISDKQWEIHYQPKFDASNNLYGFEALIRWIHPEKGLINPSIFIPVAERSDQICEIGSFVIDHVCMQTKKWVDLGYDNLVGSINLSTKELNRKSIINEIQEALDRSGLKPCNLEIELTERMMMDNKKSSLDILNQIKEIGVFLSIDDFGTGYSSFNYLKNLPIDTIKIDKTFITGIDSDEEKFKITKGIIDMGHDLKINVLAEGVETKKEFDLLESNACDKFQGFYFSKPLSSSKFKKIL